MGRRKKRSIVFIRENNSIPYAHFKYVTQKCCLGHNLKEKHSVSILTNLYMHTVSTDEKKLDRLKLKSNS